MGDIERLNIDFTGFFSELCNRSLRHVFVKIWMDEGPAALIRGYWPTVLGRSKSMTSDSISNKQELKPNNNNQLAYLKQV